MHYILTCSQGIAILENAFQTAPSIAVVAEALIFNLGKFCQVMNYLF
jgi:hypothetical protein